jgi:hypothetical protein
MEELMLATSTIERGGAAIPSTAIRNSDVDWARWPVDDYVAENYGSLHPADAAVIDHHAACYRRLAPDSLACSLELGAGPNLYPLMLAAAASRRIEAVEPSAANVGYLRRQLSHGPDPHWQPFYARCRAGNAALPVGLHEALSRVRVVRGDAWTLQAGRYQLASMNFVAESVTEDLTEFAELCQAFVRAVCPGGQLIAAFMEGMSRYAIGTRSMWPGVPVDAGIVRAVFEPCTAGLSICRIDADPSLPDYGYTGMVLLTARRAR